jgi:hypothetical protein
MEEMRVAYNILFGKSDGKRLLGRPSSVWKDIRIYLREMR